MARIVTHAEVAQVPDGGDLLIEPDAELTPLAQERAKARHIRVAVGTPASHEETVSIAARVAEQVLLQLGTHDEAIVSRVASEVLSALNPRQAVHKTPAGIAPHAAPVAMSDLQKARRRAILTSTGRNQKGVVAKLTTLLAELGGDILDISQTLVGDCFTMFIIVDIADMHVGFEELKSALSRLADSMGIYITLMHEDLVRSLHRV